MEKITYYFKVIFTVLGGAHPMRLSAGFLTGLLGKGGCDVGAEYVGDGSLVAVLSASPLWFFIALGVFIWFLPVFLGRTKISENNRAYIELVAKVIDRSNMTAAEERKAWRTLLEKMLEAFKPEGENRVDTDEALVDVTTSDQPPPQN